MERHRAGAAAGARRTLTVCVDGERGLDMSANSTHIALRVKRSSVNVREGLRLTNAHRSQTRLLIAASVHRSKMTMEPVLSGPRR